jgi:hypothetical protein
MNVWKDLKNDKKFLLIVMGLWQVTLIGFFYEYNMLIGLIKQQCTTLTRCANRRGIYKCSARWKVYITSVQPNLYYHDMTKCSNLA